MQTDTNMWLCTFVTLLTWPTNLYEQFLSKMCLDTTSFRREQIINEELYIYIYVHVYRIKDLIPVTHNQNEFAE